MIFKECPNCKASYRAISNKKYCSNSCYNEYRKTGTAKACLVCKKEYYYQKSYIDRGRNFGNYCSSSCRIEGKKQLAIKTQKPSQYRLNAWRKYDKKCYDCGFNAEPKILVIHHIDGDRNNGDISNLIPVCQNCHALRHLRMGLRHRLPPPMESFQGFDMVHPDWQYDPKNRMKINKYLSYA